MSVLDHLKNIFSTGKGSDFTIIVLDADGNKVEKKVHKIIIRQSPYFESMLDLQCKESTDGSVTITNITSDIIEYVLAFMYTTRLKEVSTTDQAIAIVFAADYFQLSKMRAAAIEEWKKSFVKLNELPDLLDACQKFADAGLGVKIDASWHMVISKLILGISANKSQLNIAQKSHECILLLVTLFAADFPLLITELLTEWTHANLSERRSVAQEMASEISVKPLCIRTLARISKSPALPPEKIVQAIQFRAEKDCPVVGHVTYEVKVIYNRVIELEFEAGFALFWFKGFGEQTELWKFIKVPENCNTSVSIRDSASKWVTNTGSLGKDEHLGQFLDKDQNIWLRITLNRPDFNANDKKYFYTLFTKS